MANGFLLLHAFPLDHSMWEPQMHLGGLAPVVAPDFPGFGEALDSPFPATIEGAADAAADAMDRAGMEAAVVCGLSMGGYVAMAFWRRHRERVLGLILANTRGDADDEAARERRFALARRLREEGNVLATAPPPLLSQDASGELLTLVKNIIANQPVESIAAAAEAMASRPDSMNDLREVSVKTLVISSEHDTLIPPAITQAVADAIPGARFEIIERAGHLSNLENHEKFDELVREHLVLCGLIKGDLPPKAGTGPA